MIDLSKIILFVLSILILSIVVVLLCYIYFRYCFTFWKRKGVPSVDPTFPFGDLTQAALGKESLFIRLKNLYDLFKSQGHDYGGVYFFNGPIFMPINLNLTKQILLPDFEHFVDRGIFHDKVNIPISYNLFAMEGGEWKNLRAKLSPAFSSGKIKIMYQILKDVSDKLVKKVEDLILTEEEINVMDVAIRYTIDNICSCAMGVEANSLNNEESEYCKLPSLLFTNSVWDIIKFFLRNDYSNYGALAKLVYKDPRIDEMFDNLVRRTIIHRKEHGLVRNDFMQILIEMFNDGAFETSTITLTNCLHELAHNQDMQDKLRKEIFRITGNNPQNVTYEQLLNTPYLDNVINETLRLYPPLPVLSRICVKDYKIPNTKVVIPKGTYVLIPIYAYGRDPEYFPNPTQFDPDRFEEKTFPAYAHLPFGEGPRICIGKRFGQLQTKLALVSLIAKYKFEPSKTVPKHLTLSPSTTNVTFHTVETVKCRVSILN